MLDLTKSDFRSAAGGARSPPFPTLLPGPNGGSSSRSASFRRNEDSPRRLAANRFCSRPGPIEKRKECARSMHLQRASRPCGIDDATLLIAEAACPRAGRSCRRVARASRKPRCWKRSSSFSRTSRAALHPHHRLAPRPGRPLWARTPALRRARVEIDRASLRASGRLARRRAHGPRDGRDLEPPEHFHRLGAETDPHPLEGLARSSSDRAPPARASVRKGLSFLLAAWSAARLMPRADRSAQGANAPRDVEQDNRARLIASS